ncbi:MAG: divalent-cation tolerance protein CutA [Candidatus Micrarchaeota archaeon]
METGIIEVQVTCGSLRDAKKIAETLVAEKLVACANINEVESVYRWKGKFEHHSEWTVHMKTAEALYAKVENRSKELNSYEQPAIFAVELKPMEEGFKKWVLENVKIL